jgi:hypothetical protein
MVFNNYLNKSKKLIIYCSNPIFDTWPQKFELDKFTNYGFDVELWSTEEIFYKLENIKAAASGSDNYLYKDLDIVKIKNLNDLENKVAELDTKAIIFILTLGSINNNNFDNPDLDIFNKHKIKYVIHHLAPNFHVPNMWFKIKFNLRSLQKRFYNHKKKPTLIIGTGSEGRRQVFKIYKNNFIYKSLPSFNVLWHKEKPIVNKKYIVFVEENVSVSPDSFLQGTANPAHDIEGYYKRINDVLEKVENWKNLKVVIGASGKYDYKANPFKNRQIIYKKTSNLIQHSELVLGHRSSGLEQAIVDYKPVLILKDQGFNNLKNKLIDSFARSYRLNSTWTNELTKTYFEKNNQVKKNLYKEIIKEYLKEENVTGTFIENVTSAFHEI